MRSFVLRIVCALIVITGMAAAQEVIPLYPGTPPGSGPESYPEKQYFSKAWTPEAGSQSRLCGAPRSEAPDK